jgi:hypothetical protein
MTPMPCNEGLIMTTSQVVFAFIFYAMCQYQFYNLCLTINHDLTHMMRVLLLLHHWIVIACYN